MEDINGVAPVLNVIPINITRGAINRMQSYHKKHGQIPEDVAIAVGTVWHQNWKENEANTMFCLYEEDNTRTTQTDNFEGKFNAGLNLQVNQQKFPLNADGTFSYNYKRERNVGQDDIIHQAMMERETFFRLRNACNPDIAPGCYSGFRRWGLGNKWALSLRVE